MSQHTSDNADGRLLLYIKGHISLHLDFIVLASEINEVFTAF